jgi:hypothetical protein
LAVKEYLVKRGIQTERGCFMDPKTGRLTKTPDDPQNFVQLDLYAQEANVVFETKVGYRCLCQATMNEVARQSDLVRNRFLCACYWISVPNFAGGIGFSNPLKEFLNANNIGHMEIRIG